MADFDITQPGDSETINGAIFEVGDQGGSGTGNYNTFLSLNANTGTVSGFNSDDGPGTLDPSNDEINHSNTETVLLANMPIVIRDGVEYYEFRLDLNENNSEPDAFISIEQFQVYLSGDGTIVSLSDLQDPTQTDLIYDLDAGGDNRVLMSEESNGSGTDDYVVFVPVSLFAGADPASTYMYLYTQLGGATPFQENAGFEEWNVQTAGTVSGVKFEDEDRDGIFDDDEVGLAGVTIYIDANDNGTLDTGERSTVTASDGSFTFYGVATDDDGVKLREILPDPSYEATNGEVDGFGPYWTAIINSVGDEVFIEIGNFVPRPSFTVAKTATEIDAAGDGIINAAGEIITYSIAVTNTGNVALENVEVNDPLLSDVALTSYTGDGNGNGVLDPGETWTYTGSYTVTQADLDSNATLEPDNVAAGSIDNTACVTAEYEGETLEPVCDDEDVDIELIDGIELIKTSGTTTITGPQIVTYSFTLTNEGNYAQEIDTVIDEGFTAGDGDDVVLYDGSVVASGDTNGDGLLQVTETWTFTYDLEITQEMFDDNLGGLLNVACATTTVEGVESCDEHDIDRYAIGIDKSVVSVDGSTDHLVVDAAGEQIVYRIEVTNEGDLPLSGLIVTDTIADTLNYVSGDTNNDNKLDTDETWVYSATYEATQEDLDSNGGGDGKIENVATADSVETDPVDDDADVPIERIGGIVLEKTSLTTFITRPEEGVPTTVTYTFTLEASDLANYAQDIDAVIDEGFRPIIGDDVTLYDGTSIADGDTNGDGLLDLDETWTFTFDLDITREMFDENVGGLVNVACATTADGIEVCDEFNIERYDIAIDKTVVSVDGSTTHLVVDEAGEEIVYRIAVTNPGDLALAGVFVTDTIADTLVPVDADMDGVIDGDVNGDGLLDLTETWVYSATYEATQGDIDTNGGGNGLIENVATADSDNTGPVEDNADVPVDRDPGLKLTKSVLDVGGDGPDGVVDQAGDVIKYKLVATNDGNTTLTGVTVTDPLTGVNYGPVTLLPDEQIILDTVEYTVTQAVLDGAGVDANGIIDGDCDIDNTAVADSDQTDAVEASAAVMLDYNPSIDLEKFVSVNGGGFVDADSPTGPEVTVNGSTATFRIELTNDGNISLTDVSITDVNWSDGTPVPIDLSGVTIHGLSDTDGDGAMDDLAVGASAWLEYTLGVNPGQHINTATVTVNETTKNGDEVTDSDDAHYFGLIGDGPGVRTPGGWGNSWKLQSYWDGVDGNEMGGDDETFPDGELLTQTVTGKDGSDLGFGIIIGDDGDFVLEDGEIFVDLATAQSLLENSTDGAKRDKLDDLARHAIATQLNLMAGNNGEDEVPDDDLSSPSEWLDQAAAWLLRASSDDCILEIAGYNGGNVIRANSSAWRDGFDGGEIESGSAILGALSEYNEDGTIDGVRFAHDADDGAFTTALSIAADEFLFG